MNTILTQDQVKAIVERGAIAGTTWLVAKGYIGASEAAQWVPLIVALGAAVYGWWINRPVAIVQAAAAMPNTVVVTDHALAVSTPEANIVSSDTNTVVKTS